MMNYNLSLRTKNLLLKFIFSLFILGIVIQFVRGIETRTFDLAFNAVHILGTQFNPITGFIYIGADLTADLFFASVFILTAVVIFRYKPTNWVIVFFALALISFAMSETDTLKRHQVIYKDGHIVVRDILSYVPTLYKAFATIAWFTLFYIFPEGKLVPRWTQRASLLWIFITILWTLFPSIPFNPIYGGSWDRTPTLSFIVFLIPISTGVYVQIYRWQRLYSPLQKQQVRWVVVGAVTMVFAGGILRYLPPPSLTSPSVATLKKVMASIPTFIFPYAVSIAVRQHQLWDLKPLISRTLIWFIMTALVVALFIVVVGAFSGIFQVQTAIPTVIATGLVAILFQPVRIRIQKQVDRYIFGMRDDPWIIMNRLSEQQQVTNMPNLLLNQIAETIAQMLKLPYLAIIVGDDDHARILASYGTPQANAYPFDMVYQSNTIGKLLVAPRDAGETFNAQDKQLLGTITQQVAAAVQLVIVNADLQQSRENLVTAREEERRRLQRDLHDGLGPRLAAHTINIGTARSQLFTRPIEADSLLERVETEIATAVNDIRHLIYELRPPALDQLGLVRAIKEFVAPYQTPAMSITVIAPHQFAKLPAALEVAIYRIVQEAVTNVIRHSQADKCVVHLSIEESIQLKIMDNGKGLPEQNHKVGIGLNSMRDRAEELGGTCMINSQTGEGTSVIIHLPM